MRAIAQGLRKQLLPALKATWRSFEGQVRLLDALSGKIGSRLLGRGIKTMRSLISWSNFVIQMALYRAGIRSKPTRHSAFAEIPALPAEQGGEIWAEGIYMQSPVMWEGLNPGYGSGMGR